MASLILVTGAAGRVGAVGRAVALITPRLCTSSPEENHPLAKGD